MSTFANKVVLVTGASSGIGAAVAEKFVLDGAKVVMVGRNEENLRNVAVKCGRLGHKPHTVVADVSKDEDDKRIIDETIKTFGKLDVLVNNAGMAGLKTSIKYDDCMTKYEETLGTNLRGPIRLINLGVKYLLKSKGNIVNISSVASVKPVGINFPYSISKAALDHFTKCIAYELGSQGIRVNSIMPGPVRTNIGNFTGPKEKVEAAYETSRLNTALLRISEPEEIADCVLFLASDKARGMTGSIILHDNGLLLKAKFK